MTMKRFTMINAIIRTNERHPINFVILPLLFLGAIFVIQNIEVGS